MLTRKIHEISTLHKIVEIQSEPKILKLAKSNIISTKRSLSEQTGKSIPEILTPPKIVEAQTAHKIMKLVESDIKFFKRSISEQIAKANQDFSTRYQSRNPLPSTKQKTYEDRLNYVLHLAGKTLMR